MVANKKNFSHSKDVLKKLTTDYHLVPFAVTALLLLILPPIIDMIFKQTQNDILAQIEYGTLKILFLLVVWGIWLLLLITSILSKLYRQKTGRSYIHDRMTYKLSYHHLINFFQQSEPHKLDTSSFPISSWTAYRGLIFGQDGNHLIAIPSQSEINAAVFGPPGSGKTAGLAIINCMQFDGSVMAVDIKGDIYNYVHTHSTRHIIRFAPDAPDALDISCHFDPFFGIENMDETGQKLFLENMAILLVPDEGGDSGNYFSSRARKLFQGITHLLLFKNSNISFPEVVHAILEGNVFDWVQEAIQSDCKPAKELLASFYGNAEKNVSGAYDALTTALVHFSNPVLDKLLAKSPSSISIATLDAGNDIYLQVSQEHLDVYAPLLSLILQSFSTAFAKRPDSSTGQTLRPILLLMDEFPQLTFSYKIINSDLSTLRSKSIICMLLMQNMSQLEQKYQPIGARSILGNCSIQVILGSSDIHSSQIFSDMCGTKKILKASSNVSSTRLSTTGGSSVQEAEVKVFPPEYFGDLSLRKKSVIFLRGKYAEVCKLNCYDET